MTPISLTVELIPIRPDPEDAWAIRCPGCQHFLALHQPDPQSPDRLIATCEECRAWFLMYATAGLLVRLPHENDLRDT